ncbi:MAG: hypothetical protein EAZ77_05785 [Nostocales cyanobacterium]|nr:MAG: hypothetical protein EAZ77_05785 [Nostocales cyanobacterium]
MNCNFSRIGAFLAGVGSAAAIVASASTANAATFTVNGTDYDITTVTGSYNSLSSQLQSQVWWGNQTLASQFATIVGSSLGISSYVGPTFAYGVTGGGMFTFANGYAYTSLVNGVTGYSPEVSNPSAVYAIATVATPSTPVSVPEPGTAIPTALVGLVALGAMGKAKKTVASKTRLNSVVS